MRKELLLFLGALTCLALPLSSFAQADSVLLDLLKSPASPAFEIMGTSPTQIARPETPTALNLSIMNATSSLSSLPENYALEFAPAWVFCGKKIDYKAFESTAPVKSIAQTFKLSVGISPVEPYLNVTSEPYSTSRMGAGFRTSIFRGKIDEDFNGYKNKIDSIQDYLKKANNDFDSLFQAEKKKNSTFMLLQAALDTLRKDPARNIEAMKAIAASIVAVEGAIKERMENDLRKDNPNIAMLKKLASQLEFRRYGWKLDLAAATSLDFRNDRADNSAITSYGAWVTGGYEWQKNWSWLGAVRVINRLPSHPENITNEDSLAVDIGTRAIFDAAGPLSISGEFLYRVNSKDKSSPTFDPENTYRYAFSLDYKVAKNKVVSFTIGKDFDKPVTTGGNLIAAINLLMGFGAQRPIQ